MQSELAWVLIGLALAIVLFILDKTMKTLPRWLIITGYATAIFLVLLGVLAMANLFQNNYIILLVAIIVLAVLIIIDLPIMRRVEIRETPASWLLRELEDDLNKIGNRIFWREYNWLTNGLTRTDPYVDLTVTLINANIYDIKVEDIRGRFLIGGQECAHAAELLSVTQIPHGESGNIAIRQRISSEMKEFMVKQVHLQDTLNVSVAPCGILVQPWIKEQKPSWISIGGDLAIPTKQFPS